MVTDIEELFDHITHDQITGYLEQSEGWELIAERTNVDIWGNRSVKGGGFPAKFYVSKSDTGRYWARSCRESLLFLCKTEQKSMLDWLILFDVVRISELFTIVDPSIDGVFKDLMKPQGTITEGFEALRNVWNGEV